MHTQRERLVLCRLEERPHCPSVHLQVSLPSLLWTPSWEHLQWSESSLKLCEGQKSWRDCTDDDKPGYRDESYCHHIPAICVHYCLDRWQPSYPLADRPGHWLQPTSFDKFCCVQIVFDCGSQHSYVTKRVARSLSLATEGEKSLTIMTFRSSRQQTRVCKLVRLVGPRKMEQRSS